MYSCYSKIWAYDPAGNDSASSSQWTYPSTQFNSSSSQDKLNPQAAEKSPWENPSGGASTSSTENRRSYKPKEYEEGSIEAVIDNLLGHVDGVNPTPISPRIAQTKQNTPPPHQMNPVVKMKSPEVATVKPPKKLKTPKDVTPKLPLCDKLEIISRSRARPIAGNPFPVVYKTPTNLLTPTQQSITVFGNDEKKKDERLCRPFGVACDREGRIIIADRSNNRIQIYKEDGTFIKRFGSTGSAPGQFFRPAGITVDEQNRIIIVDKDNHRIQVFTSEGKFLFTFGRFGAGVGQFNYPWDVATNRQCQIVISDSRNYRIQLFSPKGVFLRQHCFATKSGIPKHFTSPRGVAFNNDGNIFVTDFNNHRLLIISADLLHVKMFNLRRSGFKSGLLRPQGLVIDDDGNIVLVDTKHDRILGLDCAGNHRFTFDNQASSVGPMCRPTTVALTRSGQVIVVDFGHDRILIL